MRWPRRKLAPSDAGDVRKSDVGDREIERLHECRQGDGKGDHHGLNRGFHGS